MSMQRFKPETFPAFGTGLLRRTITCGIHLQKHSTGFQEEYSYIKDVFSL